MEQTLIDTLEIHNPFAQEQLKEGLLRWPSGLPQAKSRSAKFAALRKVAPPSPKEFALLHDAQKTLQPLLRDSTDTEKESYSQVCFQGSPWSGLNSIPYALIVLSLYKSYIVPAFSIMIPLLSWILPYIILKTFYTIPITFGEYTKLLWRLWNGQALPKTPEELASSSATAQNQPTDMMTQMRQLTQTGWTLFTVAQALWQPIQQARHFMRLDENCLTLGSSVICVKEVAMRLFNGWSQWLPSWLKQWISECPDNVREAFAFVLENPFWLRHTLRALGRFEVLVLLSARRDVVPAEFIRTSEPFLKICKFGDPAIPVESRSLSSVCLGGEQPHALLTGPNRGGKSSFMRGVLTNVKMAHAFGAAFAEAAQMNYFSWVADGLRLDDTPGETSMFEREVAFASGVLRKAGVVGGKGVAEAGLVLYDELFHSTNPPDATRTSETFCAHLWQKNCLSILSTHVYSLARNAPPNVQKLCVAAWKKKDKYKFSYTIQNGICEVSSVDLLLKQYGLLTESSSVEGKGGRERSCVFYLKNESLCPTRNDGTQ